MPKITISTYELFQMFPDQESARVITVRTFPPYGSGTEMPGVWPW